MTARTRWTLAIAALLIGNIAAVVTLAGFSHGAMKGRVVAGYDKDNAAEAAPTPAPPATAPAPTP
jgi:hypothetical protein